VNRLHKLVQNNSIAAQAQQRSGIDKKGNDYFGAVKVK
jgi:hypothetical protein